MTKLLKIFSLLLIFTVLTSCSEDSEADSIEQIKKRITQVSIAELTPEYLDNHLIIDVREPDEFASGYIENATLIPLGTLQTQFPIYLQEKLGKQTSDLKTTPVLLYCRSGNRSAVAADTLQKMGYTNVTSLQGGIKAWSETKREIIMPESNSQKSKSPFLGLRTVVYHVSDLQAAKQWYSQLLETTPYFDEPFYVGFNIGGYELGLLPDPVEGSNAGGSFAYWGVVDAKAQLKRALELGAKPHEDIQDVGDGVLVTAVTDPWGNVFGIIENAHFKAE